MQLIIKLSIETQCTDSLCMIVFMTPALVQVFHGSLLQNQFSLNSLPAKKKVREKLMSFFNYVHEHKYLLSVGIGSPLIDPS